MKSGKDGGYTWANCPFNSGSWSYNSSYWNAHKSECVDANDVLLPANDAAHVNLGGNWRMPTIEEFDELNNTSSCSWTWTTLNGIKGYKVQSKKSGYTDKWIFLPAAGYRGNVYLGGVGYYGSEYNGRYWSSSSGTDYPRVTWGQASIRTTWTLAVTTETTGTPFVPSQNSHGICPCAAGPPFRMAKLCANPNSGVDELNWKYISKEM